MRKPVLARARLILPWGLWGALFYLIGVGAVLVILSADVRWDPARKARFVNLLLFLGAILYALSRVFLIHPIFLPGYRAWLELTPWTSRKPLPLGPVELVWEDGLFLGPLILISNLLPLSLAPQLLSTFLLVHLMAVDLSLWLTRSRGFAYATAFGLGLAVWTWREPIACLVVLAATYVVTYEGLRRAMTRFPWHPRGETRPMPSSDTLVIGVHRELCGWPHDRMMADVIRCPGVRRVDAFLGTALACWWFYALVSLVTDPVAREGLSGAAFKLATIASPIVRLGSYVRGYIAPLTPWARIRTNRWIIPSFDRVYVAPACSALAGLAVVVLLEPCGVPAPASYTVAGGMTVLAALITPPRLREWRLTGGHRIVPNKDAGVGAKYKMIQTN